MMKKLTLPEIEEEEEAEDAADGLGFVSEKLDVFYRIPHLGATVLYGD